MSDEFDVAFREALRSLARVRRQLRDCAEMLPTGDDSTPGRVGDLPALRAVIECAVVDRVEPALASLNEAARLSRSARRRREPRS